MDELLDILADLSIPENYKALDRYHDFRKVFLETDQGRRVLKQVLAWGHLLRVAPIRDPVDPYRMVFSEGERNMVMRLLAVMMIEPPASRPDQTKTKTNEEET